MYAPSVPDELLVRYDVTGPRYTSYPTAPEWRDDFGPEHAALALKRAAASPEAPLSLYVHLPFCEKLCTYCGCNVVISKDHRRADTYLDSVEREVALAASLLGDRRQVTQLHLGGGTPTFLSVAQLERLHRILSAHFHIARDGENAIEVNPIVTSEAQLEALAGMGFNRLSVGVQDFDPQVQAEVNRVQSPELVAAHVEAARRFGFQSINFDLIYGLPHQTLESFERTLAQVVALRPDRLAVYSFAYLPDLKAQQRALPQFAIPTGRAKLALFLLAWETLARAGYRPIGMDHFALPGDELSLAADEGRLGRNFQGYTVKAAADTVAFGATAISHVGGAYTQSAKPLSQYAAAVSEGRLPTVKGRWCTDEDDQRRRLINGLMCNLSVLVPATYAEELTALAPLEADGLLTRVSQAEGTEVRVTALGRVFLRNAAMVFDRYLKPGSGRFSRTV